MTTTTSAAPSTTLDTGLAMGRVDLSVGDLERSLGYYQNNIGLSVLDRAAGSATLGAGSTALLHLRGQPGARVVRRATGLYHFALRGPTRRDLARVIQHFVESRTPVAGASDHLVSEALYLSDPDGHGIEIYRDRPRQHWYDAQGRFQMGTIQLDIEGVMGELGADEPAWSGLSDGTDMGHVHLQVADIAAAERFYIGVLGMDRMASMPSASFVSANGYHHHLGMNTWAGVGVPPPPESAARLLSYEIVLSSAETLAPVLERIKAAGIALSEHERGRAVRDPSGNTIVLRTA
jgi:catechol 2,3-dioxygenase